MKNFGILGKKYIIIYYIIIPILITLAYEGRNQTNRLAHEAHCFSAEVTKLSNW